MNVYLGLRSSGNRVVKPLELRKSQGLVKWLKKWTAASGTVKR